MSPETLISMIAAKGLEFGYVPGGGRPEWTAQDAAFACGGLPPRIYAALCFTYAGDESKQWTLISELQTWVGIAKRKERQAIAEWAKQREEGGPIEGRPATIWTEDACSRVGDMVQMWLLEVREPWRFARHENAPTPDLRRILIAVDKDRWRRHYSPAYEALGEEFTKWLSIGAGRMRKWLRREDFYCADV